jgi:hypothetical protein
MTKLHVTISVDNKLLPDLLDAIKLYADDVKVSLPQQPRRHDQDADVLNLAINRLSRAKPKPRPFRPRPNQTARAFILEYAKQNGAFNVNKDLIPIGEANGFKKNTLYATCQRLAKTGALNRHSNGHYQGA